MDTIVLEGLKFRAAVGVHAHEKVNKNDIVLDITLSLDLKKSGQEDNLKETVDYETLYELIVSVMQQEFHLLEAVGYRLIGEIAKAFPQVQEVKVRISKLNPPIRGVDRVSIEVNSR